MDTSRFDSLAKAVAAGTSRRTVLKGLLGLGGAALAGGVALDGHADAARRSTPTPKPVSCPGRQTWDGAACVCPDDAPDPCGPDCCATSNYPFPTSFYSECCDNACCFGTCYLEELCCPTNVRFIDGRPNPPSHKICDTNDGPLCCPFFDTCCRVDGCCETVCTDDGNACCDQEHYCPSDSSNLDVCCSDGTTCCDSGTSFNACLDLSVEGACCTTSDCGDPAQFTCIDRQCVRTGCVGGQILCSGGCLSGAEHELCPDDAAGCCQSDSETCCGSAGCCPAGHCTNQNVCCSGNDIACVDDCCPSERCRTDTGCCAVNTIACGASCCGSPEYVCNAAQQCECRTGTELCGQVPSGWPGACCPTGQCNDAYGCCDSDTTPCGETCCDNATEVCDGAGTCVCKPGLIWCDGACTEKECCGDDNSSCAALGYDLPCVQCVESRCTYADGTCADNGWCLTGHCQPCMDPTSYGCTFDGQCCSGQCLPGDAPRMCGPA